MNAYLMEDPREAERLAAKVDSQAWVTQNIAPLLAPGMRVLDVGCGPGQLASALAAMHPNVEVVGVDVSRARFEGRKTPPNVSLLPGDGRSLPFGAETFDLVYCRFLLEYMPDPARVVGELTRVARAGGRVLLQDLDGQLVWHWPPDESLERSLSVVLAHLRKTGFDPHVGRKLFSLARGAGLEDLAVQVASYHLYAGRICAADEALWETKLDIVLPRIAEALGSYQEAVALKGAFLGYLRRKDTLTHSVIFTVCGRKYSR
jgi:ubiquinone/menaquinone biosynthesis C-methylase UbiE